MTPRRFSYTYTVAVTVIASFSNNEVVAAPSSRRAGTPDKPNIILLLTDDQDVLLGGIDRMPKLRSLLVDRGTTFPNAFVHTPICCPSRSSILSGRYLHNGGAVNNSWTGNCNGARWRNDAEKKTFAVFAKEAGYVTSYAGKYLNAYSFPPNSTDLLVPPGWDKWFGLVGNSRYYDYSVVKSDNGGEAVELLNYGDDYERDYFPDGVANRTLAMIDEFTSQEEKKPFLLVNAWPTPHGPFTPAPWAEHMFDGAKAPRTRNWNASTVFMQHKHWLMRQLPPIDLETEGFIDKAYEHRLEALLSVDQHIGQIVELLEKKGELQNTIIIFTSDHGFQLGQHRLAIDKRHLYEHDIRVPFITFSGKQGRRISDQVVLNIDIAPTIYELVSGSADLPSSMDGMSFAPILQGSKVDNTITRDDFLVSYHGEGRAPCGYATCPPSAWEPDSWNNTYHCIRTVKTGIDDNLLSSNDSIYCRFEDSERFVEYYNMDVDPWQLSNKYHELSSEERAYFEARLAQLRACHGDTCRTKSHERGEATDFAETLIALEI